MGQMIFRGGAEDTMECWVVERQIGPGARWTRKTGIITETPGPVAVAARATETQRQGGEQRSRNSLHSHGTVTARSRHGHGAVMARSRHGHGTATVRSHRSPSRQALAIG